MPRTWYTSWKNIDRVLTGNALDAKYWNALVAPNNNLDYISEFRNQSNVVLALNLTSTSIANNIYTTINWTSAVYESNAEMWDISVPDTIYLLPLGFAYPSTDIWVLSVFAQWSVAGAFSAKSIYANNEPIDLYGESSAGVNSIHQYSFVKMTYQDTTETLNIGCIQSTGAANNLTASLYLQRIPSAVSLYYPVNFP
jgi:hypothetical protein